MRPAMSRGLKISLIALGGALLLALFVASRFVCLSAWVGDGVVVDECPDGEVRQGVVVDTWGLRRGGEAAVHVGAVAYYTTGPADWAAEAPVSRVSASLALVNGETVTPLPAREGWSSEGDHQTGLITLPKGLPDGDYVLRATVSSPLGESKLDVPIQVYAPARIHVITDRPLYEPGNLIQFRAVVLRARDLVPLDGRPGKWVVTDPSGTVVLEERAPAGDYGVVQGSFPLDEGAETGSWGVRWESGSASDEVSVRVEPFTLPRFTVDAASVRPYYRRGERPVLNGTVRYASGAPVSGARIDLEWGSQGDWPPPTAWMSGELPARTFADASGRFELRLPEVPRDLRGQATLLARLSAVDPAGDRSEGSASVLLSEDAIMIETVTELDDGLVDGFNNRLYLRATTAAGAVLAKTRLHVKRTWDAADTGIETMTDEDGVAAIQIDPGAPVNIVIPAMPARPPPRPAPVARRGARDLVPGRALPLADVVAMDRFDELLAPCARFVASENEALTFTLRAAESGRVVGLSHAGTPLSRCVARVLSDRSLPPGTERLYELTYHFSADLPRIDFQVTAAPWAPSTLDEAVREATLDARSCLPEDVDSMVIGRALFFTLRKGKKSAELSFARDPRAGARVAPPAIASCIERRLLQLDFAWAPPASDGGLDTHVGVYRFQIEAARRYELAREEDTVMLGYELSVEASAGTEEIGRTKVRFDPGTVPDIRLRATPPLARGGEKVEIALLRGPNFSGELPKTMHLSHDQGSLEEKLDPETKKVVFTLPADAKGWYQASYYGARALVFVRTDAELSVEVKPEQPKYAPGELARLRISTRRGERPMAAAVGLFGVDETLGQLAALPGPTALSRLRTLPESDEPAFGVLDAEALVMGRVQGANAQAATVLRVSTLPTPEDLDTSLSASGHTTFEPVGVLTDHFYTVLAELHDQTRRWESETKAEERMKPAVMASLWSKSLAGVKARGESTVDAFGRQLRLHQLPEDLLALTDPRAVVIEGTRLPEDVENWPEWVRREQP